MQQRRRTRGGFKDCTKQLAAASAHTGSSRADRTCQEPPPFNSCANKPWQRLPRLEFRNGNSSSQPGSPARNQIEISRGSIQNSTKSCYFDLISPNCLCTFFQVFSTPSIQYVNRGCLVYHVFPLYWVAHTPTDVPAQQFGLR